MNLFEIYPIALLKKKNTFFAKNEKKKKLLFCQPIEKTRKEAINTFSTLTYRTVLIARCPFPETPETFREPLLVTG